MAVSPASAPLTSGIYSSSKALWQSLEHDEQDPYEGTGGEHGKLLPEKQTRPSWRCVSPPCGAGAHQGMGGVQPQRIHPTQEQISKAGNWSPMETLSPPQLWEWGEISHGELKGVVSWESSTGLGVQGPLPTLAQPLTQRMPSEK